ncbi:E3 ubiquitin-protein ligase rad18, partial [Actinomortierella ambigua]
ELLLKTVQDSVRRANEDQERLVARSGKNGRGDRNDDDMDGDYGNSYGGEGDSDGDVAAGKGSKGSSSSSRISSSANPNKRKRASARRRAAAEAAAVAMSRNSQTDSYSEDWMVDEDDDVVFEEELSQRSNSTAPTTSTAATAAASGAVKVATRSSQRQLRSRGGDGNNPPVEPDEMGDNDFQIEYRDRIRTVIPKRVTRHSQASEQQHQEHQDPQQSSGASTRTRSGSRTTVTTASQSTAMTDSPSASPASSQTLTPAPPARQEPTISPETFGLCACPVCGCAILHESVNRHLDQCMEGKRDPKYNAQYEQVKMMDQESMQQYAKHGTGPRPSAVGMMMNNRMGPSSPSSGRRGGGVGGMSPSSPSLSSSSGGNPFYREGNGHGSSHGGKGMSWSLQAAGSPSSSSNSLVANGSVTKYPERRPLLPKLAYGVLNDKQLRKKLQELGLPSHGDKALMQKRHAEYLTRYNANCDALRPFSDAELKRQMVDWERAYGLDLQARDQQRRAQEALQRQVQEEQHQLQQLRLSQEMAAAVSSSQGSLSQEVTVGGGGGEEAIGASGSGPAAILPLSSSSSSSSSSSLTSTTTTTAPAFIPNHTNNTNAAVVVAEAASFAHAARYADEYAELIASVRRRIELAKVKERENEAAAATNLEG